MTRIQAIDPKNAQGQVKEQLDGVQNPSDSFPILSQRLHNRRRLWNHTLRPARHFQAESSMQNYENKLL